MIVDSTPRAEDFNERFLKLALLVEKLTHKIIILPYVAKNSEMYSQKGIDNNFDIIINNLKEFINEK